MRLSEVDRDSIRKFRSLVGFSFDGTLLFYLNSILRLSYSFYYLGEVRSLVYELVGKKVSGVLYISIRESMCGIKRSWNETF
jgi:hypothetical protein